MPICEADLRVIALTQVPFAVAALAWLETRKPYLTSKTLHEYELNIKTLGKFFGEMRLQEITGDQIRAYQRMRMAQCGPFAINHECSVLQQMLKRIGRWAEIDYQPLKLPKARVGRALTDEQYERLFAAAQSNPNWEAAYLFARISVNTTAGPKEVATLHLKDIDLAAPNMTVQAEGAKNPGRIRVIPLNLDAVTAIKLAMARAQALGAVEPQHYLFPFRIHRGSYDPARHQTTFKTAWLRLTERASLGGLRMYDLRHHAITVLLEDPETSEETAEAIAGHIRRETKKHYSHTRLEAKRRAVEALIRKASRPRTPKKSSVSTESADVGQQLIDLLGKLLKTG